ncbi:ATP-binding cassette domain-containing protein [Rhodoblastus acidophilus]|uniref:ATP-binding cassette domain-containing protein n=1 Tax=Rhodoblastus acidophilus TaxID=1074 RepID=A0A6N8DPW8_RHOAC|nr:peptidase domain-containing ABC transporter [Rhodoblastus acidophilus]MCW2275733.1 ATP-binding cassette subfamily B protein [Rhodoblastus acidophilus]MTV31896.1 ATP-binding cassette domain-containing protein [Rhodoblastus acidophilus]
MASTEILPANAAGRSKGSDDKGFHHDAGQKHKSALECLCLVAAHHAHAITVDEIVRDNALSDQAVDYDGLVHCARKAGFKARLVHLDWEGLTQIGKAVPAIVRLKTGASLVLARVAADNGAPLGVLLHDPNAAEGAELFVDWLRFQEIWTGELVLVRRNYDLKDEEQPFSLSLIAALIFRERRLARDIAICALILSLIALAPILYYQLMMSKVITYRAMDTFTVLSVGLLVFIVFETIFGFLRSYMLQILTSRVDVRLSEYMFDRMLALPIDFYERTEVGGVMFQVNEMWKIRSFLTGQLFGTVLDSMTLLFFLPVMFAFSPLLTFIVLGFCGLIVVWLVAMLPTFREATGRVIEAQTARGSFLYQTVAGMRTVKSLALESRQRREWDILVARVAKTLDRQAKIAAIVQTGVRPLERLAVVGSYGVGVYMALVTNDPAYTGSLFAFLLLSQRVAGPLMQMAQLITQGDEARAAVGVVSKFLNQPREEGIGDGGVRKPLVGHVEFSQVRFTYKGALSPAIDDVSFEIPVGMTLGVVGRSGSGKTTLTRLLQRLHSEYEGLIKIDGVDVREYNVAHLRRNLGVVLQENFLFRGTIRENIMAAKPNATFDDVVRAARLSGAEEFIDRLPRGYDTYIYEGSPNLSGGQRQRLAIARCMILDPKILIFDEATSALDPDSESIVNDNIRKIAKGRTVIVISHRLSSLVNSDAILVLERGKVLDVAPHRVLLERCEIYRGLWLQQNGHIEAAATNRAAARGASLV